MPSKLVGQLFPFGNCPGNLQLLPGCTDQSLGLLPTKPFEALRDPSKSRIDSLVSENKSEGGARRGSEARAENTALAGKQI